MRATFECWDCEEPEPYDMKQARKPFFPSEHTDSEGNRVRCLLICTECWSQWDDGVRLPLEQEKLI